MIKENALKKQLRIAVVTETYSPEINGVAKTTSYIVQELRSRGHFLQVVRPRQGAHDCHGNATNGEDITLPGLKIPVYRDLRLGLPANRFLGNLWKINPPDLVHAITEGPLGWSAVRTAKKLRLPVISDFHTNFHSYSQYYRLGIFQKPVEKYLRFFHNRTDCTLVPTGELKNTLTAKGYKKVEVVGRGVDTMLFSPSQKDSSLRRSWGLTEKDMAVLYVGRIAAEKNILLAIEAFHHMKARDPGMRLILVGDGPLRKRIAHDHPEVIFTGMQRGESLAKHYASADIFLFPSITETFGIVVLEAMASRLAIVAFNYAAARQYLKNNDSALLASFNDNDDFIRIACSIAGCKDTITKLGHQAHANAKTCTWENVTSQLENRYFSLVNSEGKGPCSTTH